jgi:aminoglycoside phosphotransferase (APT) family kinase protein
MPTSLAAATNSVNALSAWGDDDNASMARRFLPADRFGEVREIAPITVGLSGSTVYSVATSTGDYVLRIHAGDKDSWKRVVALQRLAAEHGIAPRLVHIDDAQSATVSVKIAGLPFGAAMAEPSSRQALLGSLVERLALLHGLPSAGMDAEDPTELARLLWDEQVRRPGFPAWAVPLGERLAATSKTLAADPRRVVSHNDLNPANLIWDGRQVWLVDWERAGLAHPYLDLATFANFLDLPDEAALGLLAEQERAPLDATQQGTFTAIRDLVRIAYGAVFLYLIPDLTAVHFAHRDQTPTLAQCYALMAAGTLVMNEPAGQALMAAALLRQCDPVG